MKKFVLASLIATLFALTIATVALADPPTPNPGNSEPGIDRYLEISSNPNPDAQCGTGGGSGSFGYFGKDWNLGNEVSGHYVGSHGWDGTPGANGYQTGLNNSGVCGNR